VPFKYTSKLNFFFYDISAVSALTLFMLGVFADNHYFAFSLDDFAFFANRFY